MILRKQLPEKYRIWNKRYGAPFGKFNKIGKIKNILPFSVSLFDKLSGPFSIQPNNTTRIVEYPWAFFSTPLKPGFNILEIGGGLSGFQFILDKNGCNVVNIDPGMDAINIGWPCDHETMDKLNKRYKTNVELKKTTIDEADLSPESFDRVYSISVIEHLLDNEIEEVIKHAYNALKPGGYFTLTVDLFINIQPFTDSVNNKYGKNISIKKLIEYAPFELIKGMKEELYGFDEFNQKNITSNFDKYFLGKYPALAQGFVLQKPTNKECARVRAK